jgi:hypothetical protein
MPRDPAKPDKPKDPWKRGPSPVAGGRRGEGEVSTHDLQYATVAAIHGNRRKRHTTDWREGRARLWFAGVAGLRPWSIGTMALQVVMSEAAAVSEVQQQSTAAGPFFGDTQGLPVLLSPAQRPLTATSLVVRDEEAAGSNPVTPTVFPQVRALTRVGEGLSCCQYRNKIPQVPQQIRTLTCSSNGLPQPCAALRWDEEAAWSKTTAVREEVLLRSRQARHARAVAERPHGMRSGSRPAQDGAPAIASAFPVVA